MPINLTTSNVKRKFDEIFQKESDYQSFLANLQAFIDYYNSHDIVQKACLKLINDPVYEIYVRAEQLKTRSIERQSTQHIRLANQRKTYK